MIRRKLGILCLIGAVLLFGQSPLEDAVSRAEDLAGQGEHEAAARAWDEALSLADPSNDELMAELFYELARAKGNSGDIQGALIEIQRAKSFNDLEAYRTLHAELQTHEAASGTITSAGQIRDALASIKNSRSFEAARGRPRLNIWVGFEYDSAELSSRGERQASEMADAMLDPQFDRDGFLLIGHTDTRGSADYNFDLSLKRAQRLRDYLVQRFGFRGERITVEGRGELEPVAHGNRSSDHAANRRVEIQFVD